VEAVGIVERVQLLVWEIPGAGFAVLEWRQASEKFER
jgi:hypothetical protein